MGIIETLEEMIPDFDDPNADISDKEDASP